MYTYFSFDLVRFPQLYYIVNVMQELGFKRHTDSNNNSQTKENIKGSSGGGLKSLKLRKEDALVRGKWIRGTE